MSNFKRFGTIPTLNYLLVALGTDDLSRKSIRENLDNQKDTRVSVGLFNILDDYDGFGDEVTFNKYFIYLKKVIDRVKEEYGYERVELKSLLVVKLLANGIISEHIDEAGMYKYAHRIHIPLITNNDCVFTVGGECGRMSVGEIVEIDNTVAHSVVNGSEDRVHIVIDIVGFHDKYDFKALHNRIPEGFYI